jgi:hypothetical protein
VIQEIIDAVRAAASHAHKGSLYSDAGLVMHSDCIIQAILALLKYVQLRSGPGDVFDECDHIIFTLLSWGCGPVLCW